MIFYRMTLLLGLLLLFFHSKASWFSGMNHEVSLDVIACPISLSVNIGYFKVMKTSTIKSFLSMPWWSLISVSLDTFWFQVLRNPEIPVSLISVGVKTFYPALAEKPPVSSCLSPIPDRALLISKNSTGHTCFR